MVDDYLLFAVAPYAAWFCLLLVFAARLAAGVAAPATVNRHRDRPPFGYRLVVMCAVTAALVMHVLLLVAPDAVLQWNRTTPRLLLLEGVGLCVGLTSCIAAALAIGRGATASRSSARPLSDLIALTLVGLAVSSGVALAVVYRWASSWSVVTLTPSRNP